LGIASGPWIAGCDDSAPATTTGAGGQGGGTGGGSSSALDCPASGVLHGPWSLRFTSSSATVRWDACAPSSTEIVVEPEDGGGAPQMVSGEQRASDVRTSYDVINGVPADLPGVYYRTEVEVGGLEAGRCYRYTLAADSARGGRFCTARASGDSFTFLAIGDTNPGVGDTAGVLQAGLAANPDFTIHLGDIQYYASVFDSWSAWFPAMQPLLAQGAFMPSLGNHEYEIDFEFQDYYERLFGGAGFDGPVEYYRFNSGGVWFFSLSTEEPLEAGSAQADWLETQLADAAAQPGFRFSVVYFHKPFMTLAGYSQKTGAREHFRPLFSQHGVKLVMNGHVHGYERFVDGDLSYVVSGGGGAALHDLEEKRDERPTEAGLRQAAAASYHATLIEVASDEIRGRAISNEGVELDAFTIALP
jgi:hypothetical protein